MEGRLASQQYGSVPNVMYRNALPPGFDMPKKLCSMVPWDLYVSHWSMQATLPGAVGDKPGVLMIPAGEDKQDFGNNNFVVLKCHTGNTMALDIMGLDPKEVQEDNTPKPGRTSSWWEMGVFVPLGEDPTQEEIKAAKARFATWAAKQVEEGDMIFQQLKSVGAVPSIAKKAAKALRIEREWIQGVTPGTQMLDCPCCQNRIKPKARKCQFCGELIEYDQKGTPIWAGDPARKRPA